MKKLIILWLLLAFICSACPAIAENEELPEEKEITIYETVTGEETAFYLLCHIRESMKIIQKKECGSFEVESINEEDPEIVRLAKSIKFTASSVKDLDTDTILYALLLTGSYMRYDDDYVKITGYIDKDEMTELIQSLNYIQTHIFDSDNYTEMNYITKGGIHFGANYSSLTDEGECCIKFGSAKYSFPFLALNRLIEKLESANAILNGME